MNDWEELLETVAKPAVARSQTLKSLAVGPGLLAQSGEILKQAFEFDRLVVFADEAGFGAAGDAFVKSASAAGFTVATHIIPAHPRPMASVELAQTFEPLIAENDSVPIALGSGVMNDLVKYAAFQQNRPYGVVATAASMDGYASAGAPLSKDGFKITIPVRCPRVIIADLDVIAAAPAEMVGWGYGDLCGKVPAGADWIVADALGIEPIDADVWALVQDHLLESLADPAAVRAGGISSIAKLFTGLTMSGLAMEFHSSSRPASGAEHQMAHLWEMQHISFNGERVSHGACVAVGTITILALYEWLLEQDLTALDIDRIVAEAPSLETRFAEIDTLISTPEIARSAHKQTAAKHIEGAELKARLETVTKVWPALKRRLAAQLIPAAAMRAKLMAAGAPVTAAGIGLTDNEHKAAAYACRFLRSRYTILDLMAETGLLGAGIEHIFANPPGNG